MHIELQSSSELEEGLRNGVVLARLANFYAPDLISEKKIYDINFENFKVARAPLCGVLTVSL